MLIMSIDHDIVWAAKFTSLNHAEMHGKMPSDSGRLQRTGRLNLIQPKLARLFDQQPYAVPDVQKTSIFLELDYRAKGDWISRLWASDVVT